MRKRVPIDLSLYLVLQPSACRGDVIETLESAIRGGVTAVQLRDKELSDRAFYELAVAVRQVTKALNCPLIVNDRVDIALSVGADGIHLGQTDFPFASARRLLPRDQIIGLSVEDKSDFMESLKLDVDYLGISPVFLTPTKPELAKSWGVEGIKKIVAESHVPVVGIGGINPENASQVFDAGVDGIAVVSAICGSSDPKLAASTLSSHIPPKKQESSALSPKRYFRALTIAGSDSGGGAGIQADLKTFSALGCYGSSVITAVTAQNTLGVSEIQACSPSVVESQMDGVLGDIGADAIKIGMLFSEEIILAVANQLKRHTQAEVVLDPVMVAKSGDRLLQEDAASRLVSALFPLSSLVTPNIPEAEAILGKAIRTKAEMESAAFELGRLGPKAILVKGGHLGETSDDCLLEVGAGKVTWFKGSRVDTKNTHGTGCTLSSAIAAFLAKGFGLEAAVFEAKQYLQGALQEGSGYTLGEGHGPVNHFWEMWS